MTELAHSLTPDAARQLEDAFLAGLNDAQDAYERIVQASAWTALGYDSFAEWWDERVRPIMRALSMRPTREIAAAVIEQVRQEEADLPPAQRRTQRELADLVDVHPDTVSGRKRQDHAKAEAPAGDDLGEPAEPTLWPKVATPGVPDEHADGDARRDAELDAALADTATRFRANFSTAVARADDLWQFDVDRIVEVYALDYDRAVKPFLEEMTRWCERVAVARRRQTSGLRVVNGGIR